MKQLTRSMIVASVLPLLVYVLLLACTEAGTEFAAGLAIATVIAYAALSSLKPTLRVAFATAGAAAFAGSLTAYLMGLAVFMGVFFITIEVALISVVADAIKQGKEQITQTGMTVAGMIQIVFLFASFYGATIILT